MGALAMPVTASVASPAKAAAPGRAASENKLVIIAAGPLLQRLRVMAVQFTGRAGLLPESTHGPAARAWPGPFRRQMTDGSKILHFAEPPPKPESFPKETSCHICYTCFSYTAWRYECRECGHAFCSQHGSQIASDQAVGQQNFYCVECFLPRKIAMIDNSIADALEEIELVNLNRVPANGPHATVCFQEQANTDSSSQCVGLCQTTPNIILPNENHETGALPLPVDPTKSFIVNVESRRDSESKQQQAAGTASVGLLASAVASPIGVGRAVFDGTVGLVAAGSGLLVRGAAGGVVAAGSLVSSVAAVAAAAPLLSSPGAGTLEHTSLSRNDALGGKVDGEQLDITMITAGEPGQIDRKGLMPPFTQRHAPLA